MYQVRYKEGKVNVMLRRFKTKTQATTFIGIEMCQMEMAESKGELVIVKEKIEPEILTYHQKKMFAYMKHNII